MSTRSKSKKAKQAEAQAELDMNSKMDRMLQAIESLQTQNENLNEKVLDVSQRLESVEDTTHPNRYDVLTRDKTRDGHSTENETECDASDSPALDNKLRRLVESRLKKLGDANSSSSSSDDEVSFKTSKLTKKEKKNLKKSGKLRTAHTKIDRHVDWPHLHVYRRDGKGAEYDSLSLSEFVYGYLQCMKLEKDSKIRSYMYEHMMNLSADASDYQWPVVRNFHSVILSMIETKRLDWHQTSVIQDLRRQYVHATPMKSVYSPSQSSVKPCSEYQYGKCTKSGNHDGMQHVCAYCLNTLATTCKHPEYMCRKKSGSSYNGLSPLDNSHQPAHQFTASPEAKNETGGE